MHEEKVMDAVPQVISTRQRFHGAVFSVRTDELRYDDGAVHAVDIVEHSGASAVIAINERDELILVKQYRHALRREVWEIPAGRLEPGEDPVAGGLRELAEETGYRASSARSLGAFAMTPGFCEEIIHFIHATGLSPGERALDPDERITVASFSAERAQRLVETGQIADAKTLIALLWFRGDRAELVASRADN